jgi:hypothetical protein
MYITTDFVGSDFFGFFPGKFSMVFDKNAEQSLISGHFMQSGFDRVHTVAPKSIMPWV